MLRPLCFPAWLRPRSLRARHAGLAVACLAAWPSAPRAQSVPPPLRVETLAQGLRAPVAFEFLPDGRVLFAEQFTGQVRVFRLGSGVQPAAVLNVPDVAAGGERGLLGVAIDPAFPGRPYVYVFHDVATPRHIRIARFTLAGDLAGSGTGTLTADPASRFDLVDDIPDQADHHNGGTLRFDLDGCLLASVGEDGVPCAAQDSVSLRGVILRLRTDALPPGPGRAFRAQVTPGANPFAASRDSNLRLVAALGLRNPFRFQVDPVGGTLVIGDVGENLREELDLLATRPTGGLEPAAPLGADFGWPYREGFAPGVHRNDCASEPPGLVAPVFDYDRTPQQGGAAIIAAGVYRALAGRPLGWPARYSGDLFFNDYYSGVLVRLVAANGSWSVPPPEPGQPSADAWGVGFEAVSDWRLGPDGALWFCRQSIGFAANSGSLGRIAGPGSSIPPPAIGVVLLGSPAVAGAVFGLTADRSQPGRLTVLDVTGRIVRRWRNDEFERAPDGLRVTWNGRDEAGNAVRPGLFVARLESAGRATAARFMFLR